ncbi:MAG: thiamine pyrophosphate-binding protein [Bacillota bacterium]
MATLEEGKNVPLGMREMYPTAGNYIGEGLKEHNVSIAFGVSGGHIWNMVDNISYAGVKLITVQHEQAAVYAAEAYARVSGRTGVVFATVGPGVANCFSALNQAKLSCTPIVMLCGGNSTEHDGTFVIQSGNAEEMLPSVTKWAKRCDRPAMWKHWMAKAFQDAQAYPKGPVAMEFTIRGLIYDAIPPNAPPGPFGEHYLYAPEWKGADKMGKPVTSGGDPEVIAEAVNLIAASRHPLIVAGDGVHWSKGSKELMELCVLLQIPISTRRIARGSVPDTSPYYLSNKIVNKGLKECDLVISVGMKVGAFDNDFGSVWPRAIQIAESEQHVWTFVKNTECIVLGTPRVVLRQMIDYCKANSITASQDHREWLERCSQMQSGRYEEVNAKAIKYANHAPVHHGFLSKVICDTCEELYNGENRFILDGYTMSGYFPAFMKLRYSGQCLDASEQAGVGHGVGMAIGAAFADREDSKPNVPVIALMGDAGMGNSGMDVETAARYKLPIVYLVTNNGGWLTGMKYLYYGENWDSMGPQDHGTGQEFISGIRYDKIAEYLGCHGEYVTRPEQIRPALERAFKAAEGGQPAVINVEVDKTLSNPVTHTAGYTVCWAHVPYDKITKRGKALRRNFMRAFPWDQVGEPEMPMPDPWEPVGPDGY